MHRFFFLISVLILLSSLGTAVADSPWEPIPGLDESTNPDDVVVAYETTADKSRLFRKETISFGGAGDVDATLTLDPETTFQTVDGFGAAITG